MILNGKAKEEFLQWKVNNKNLSTIEVLDFKHLSEISRNALIIEWFDSVGVWDRVFYEVYIESTPTTEFKQILNRAIIKANEIYNKQ